MKAAQGRSGMPGDDQGEPSLGWLLSSLGQQAASGFRSALPDGIHPRQFAVLQQLRAAAAGEALSQRALADALAIPPSRLVPLIDDLQSRGWVERIPDAHDRRPNLIRLTAPGASAAEALRLVGQHYEQTITTGLSTTERSQLHELLRKLTFPGGPTPRIW